MKLLFQVLRPVSFKVCNTPGNAAGKSSAIRPGPICSAATVHLAAAVPNFAWMEIRESPTESTGFYDAELFPTKIEQDGPRLHILYVPGLGVYFNDDFASSRPYQPSPENFLNREDGSLTNS